MVPVEATVVILKDVKQLKKRFTYKYFEKNVRLWTLITFRYRKLCYHYNTWVIDVYAWQNFHKKNITNLLIIWIKLKVHWLL